MLGVGGVWLGQGWIQWKNPWVCAQSVKGLSLMTQDFSWVTGGKLQKADEGRWTKSWDQVKPWLIQENWRKERE